MKSREGRTISKKKRRLGKRTMEIKKKSRTVRKKRELRKRGKRKKEGECGEEAKRWEMKLNKSCRQ